MCNPEIRRTFGYYGRSVGALTRLDLTEKVCALSLPTLILHGTRDNVLPPAAAEELHRCIKGSTLVMLEGARHSLFFTHHQEVNAALAEFITNLR